jgi:hypothetical protein
MELTQEIVMTLFILIVMPAVVVILLVQGVEFMETLMVLMPMLVQPHILTVEHGGTQMTGLIVLVMIH